MGAVQFLVIAPRGELRVGRVADPVEVDQAHRREGFQVGGDVLGQHPGGVVGEDHHAKLVGVGVQASVVVGLGDHTDPEAVLPIGEEPNLAMEFVVRLERADSRHGCLDFSVALMRL